MRAASVLGLLGRAVAAVLLAAVLLAAATVVLFFLLGGLFGLTGHPAGPDLPAGCYTVYLFAAPIIGLGVSFWIVSRIGRRRPAGREGGGS